MRILEAIHFFSLPHGGGSVDVVYNLSKNLSKRGHKVTIYTSDFELDQNYIKSLENVDVLPFHSILNFSKLYITPRLITQLKNEIRNFDIIHIHCYRSFQNIIVHHYAMKYGVPYVLQAHGSLPSFMVKQRSKLIYDVFFGYRILKGASKVIALSQTEAQQYRSMGVPEEKIAVIPNGIDLPEYDNLPPKGSFKKKFGVDDDEKIVLYVGRVHKIKGIDFLIKSFAYLVKNDMKNPRLIIVGPDDGYLSKAQELARSIGISSSVLFTGFITKEEKVSAYIDSAIVVYPGQHEPFGLVPLEAAVFSKPVVVTKGTIMSEIVENGKFGFSVKYNDLSEFAKMMRRMLNDKQLSKRMGEQGSDFISKNFSWDNITEKFEKVYDEVAR